MTSVRRFLRPSCFIPYPWEEVLSPVFVLPHGSKRGNRVTMLTWKGSPFSLSLPFPTLCSLCLFLSISVSYIRATRARIRDVWCGVVWRGAMWPRLDSIRVAAADRCVAMTTLPPPVIQLPPRTPLSRPPPPLPPPTRPPAAAALPLPSRVGWASGCPLIVPFVTSTVIVSHHDPLREAIRFREVSRRWGRRRYARRPPILIDAFLKRPKSPLLMYLHPPIGIPHFIIIAYIILSESYLIFRNDKFGSEFHHDLSPNSINMRVIKIS